MLTCDYCKSGLVPKGTRFSFQFSCKDELCKGSKFNAAYIEKDVNKKIICMSYTFLYNNSTYHAYSSETLLSIYESISKCVVSIVDPDVKFSSISELRDYVLKYLNLIVFL